MFVHATELTLGQRTSQAGQPSATSDISLADPIKTEGPAP